MWKTEESEVKDKYKKMALANKKKYDEQVKAVDKEAEKDPVVTEKPKKESSSTPKAKKTKKNL